MNLDNAEKLEFKRNGFVVLRDRLDKSLCSEFRDRILDAYPEMMRNLDESESPGQTVTEEYIDLFESDLQKELVTEAYRYAADLVGPDNLASPEERPTKFCMHGCHTILDRKNTPEVEHDGIFMPIVKMPKGHQSWTDDGAHLDGVPGEYGGDDVSYLPFTVGAAIYFDDISPRGGGFSVWPGSHRKTERYFQENSFSDYMTGHPEKNLFSNLDLGRPFEIAGETGTLILFHPGLVHQAGPNRSESPRLAGFTRFSRTDIEEFSEEILRDRWVQFDSIREISGDINGPY